MVVNEVGFKTILWLTLGFCIQSTEETEPFRDQTTSRPNTLLDDADDIQKQLDNEVRDRISFGMKRHERQAVTDNAVDVDTESSGSDSNATAPSDKDMESSGSDCKATAPSEPTSAPAPIFNQAPSLNDMMEADWNYNEQHKWSEKYAECAGRSQSPVDVPVQGLVSARAGRRLKFINYDVPPQKWMLHSDEQKVIMYGSWAKNERPYITGGAAHNRLYLFYCLLVHWPSEHHIGNLMYPMETQALYVSSDYETFDDALKASYDPQAFIGVSTIYKYSDKTHGGIEAIFKALVTKNPEGSAIPLQPLSFFNPPFRKYACYQGSLSFPPCKESVLWLIRGRALPVTRKVIECLHKYNMYGSELQPIQFFIRSSQSLNDRRVLLFG